MLLGLARPTRGQALVFGRPFAELEQPAARVGAVLEASDLHPGRTGRDHLRVLARAARVPQSRVDEVLAGQPVENLLAPGVGAAVLAAWTLAVVVAATVRTDRSDV